MMDDGMTWVTKLKGAWDLCRFRMEAARFWVGRFGWIYLFP